MPAGRRAPLGKATMEVTAPPMALVTLTAVAVAVQVQLVRLLVCQSQVLAARVWHRLSPELR